MIKVELSDSKRKGKRMRAVLYNFENRKIKTLHFGSSKKQTYIDHGDELRKKRYIQRHINDKLDEVSPGSLSLYLLWNKKTLKEAIKDYEKRFNVRISHL